MASASDLPDLPGFSLQLSRGLSQEAGLLCTSLTLPALQLQTNRKQKSFHLIKKTQDCFSSKQKETKVKL